MILHIGNNSKAFFIPFLDNLKKHHNYADHTIVIFSSKIAYDLSLYPNIVYLYKINDLIKIFKLMKQSKKIIFHSMFLSKKILLLFLFVSKKYYLNSYWMIWGGDLYNRIWDRNKSIRRYFDYYLTKKLTRRIKNIIAVIDGDYGFAKKYYRTKANFIKMTLYPNSSDIDFIDDLDNSERDLKVLVGNSATRDNNHIQTLEILKGISDIEIYCPLSYGNDEIRDEVVSLGEKTFGENFYPITEFMSLEEYHDFLKSIDIAIFNHIRQQALGNIIALIGMGKKVYLNSESPIYKDFIRYGFKIFDIHSINSNEKLLKLKGDDSIKNHELYKSHFGLKNYNSNWSKIYSENL